MPAELSLKLPSHFELQRGERGVLAVRRDAALELECAGFSLEGDGRGRSAGLAGRHPVVLLGPPERELVLRRFTHGGLLRLLTGARFADPRRPFVELELSERLRTSGVLTPEVVAARARRARLAGWELALVTRRVPQARDGGELLRLAARGELPVPERHAAFAAAGSLVARLHALGFLHADLHPKNLLFASAGAAGEAWLLDLDRSRFQGTLEAGQRAANLARLVRYIERRKARGELALERTDIARFLRAYAPDRALRRRAWSEVRASYVRSLRWHRLGWWLGAS